MSLLKKLKEVGFNIAVKLNLNEVVKNMAENDPSLVTQEVIVSSIKLGHKESLISLLNANGEISLNDSKKFIQALGETTLEGYQDTAPVLISRNLIQEHGQFSDLLRIHSTHAQGFNNPKMSSIIKDLTIQRGKTYKIEPEEITQAVVQNIDVVPGNMLIELKEDNKLIDQGNIYDSFITGYNDKAKMGLIGLAANANNFSALHALEMTNFSLSANDMIATQDMAARFDKRYLYEEKIANARQYNKITPEAITLLKSQHFSNGPINFAIPGARGHSTEGPVDSAIKIDFKIPDKHSCPAALVPYKDDGVFSWHDYSAQDIRTLAFRSSYINDYQKNRSSPEMIEAVEKVITDRFELYKKTNKELQSTGELITLSPIHIEQIASNRNTEKNTQDTSPKMSM